MTAHQVGGVEEVRRVSPEELNELRAGLEAYAVQVAAHVDIAHVHDVELASGRPARTYVPDGADDSVLVWFHGGGYIAGSLAAIDPVCRWLARRLGSTVVSVDYRLAPEHPFPAAVEDALAAVESLGLRQGRLFVGGDSAGGGLAAAVAGLTAVPLSGLVLLCPWLDLTVRAPGFSADLTPEALTTFSRLYVGPAGDATDPRASPLLAKELAGLPPTVIVGADHDPLGYQAVAYAERLTDADVPVTIRMWPYNHGFVGQTAELPAAGEALDWAADQLRLFIH